MPETIVSLSRRIRSRRSSASKRASSDRLAPARRAVPVTTGRTSLHPITTATSASEPRCSSSGRVDIVFAVTAIAPAARMPK
jgi:hypothetical protein